MLLLSLIPVVNIVMFFVWAFGSENPSRRNFGRAQLLILLIGVVLCVLFGAALLSLFSLLVSSR